MAMSKLEAIMDIFAANNKADTPVAIIQEGTTANEKMVVGKVKDISFKAQYAGLKNPAIIVVGEVVNLYTPEFDDVVQQHLNSNSISLKRQF
jgi:uroporphyrin-III C-methyltransferase